MTSRTTAAVSRILVILFLLGLAISPSPHAGTLNSSIINMFPKDTKELRYADLSGSREFPWYPPFEEQIVPACVLGFEKFLEAAQVQQPPSIDQVAWARVSISGSGQLVTVGTGQFDIETIKFFLNSRNVRSVQVGSNVLYASQTDLGMSEGYFALIDSETIAFGPLEGLKRIIEIRAGNGGNLSGNPKMMAMINQVNNNAAFWDVLDSGEAGTAAQHLVPDMMKFPQANDLVGKLKQLSISVRASDEIELNFQVDSASSGDAIVLSQLLEADMLSKRYQASRNNPGISKILDGILITPSGSHLDIDLNMTGDQMLTLIEHNTLKLSM